MLDKGKKDCIIFSNMQCINFVYVSHTLLHTDVGVVLWVHGYLTCSLLIAVQQPLSDDVHLGVSQGQSAQVEHLR